MLLDPFTIALLDRCASVQYVTACGLHADLHTEHCDQAWLAAWSHT